MWLAKAELCVNYLGPSVAWKDIIYIREQTLIFQ